MQSERSPERTESGVSGCSSRVRSKQEGVHPHLIKTVSRHLEAPWLAPIHHASREAFEQVCLLLGRDQEMPMILDSGCGTGQSTRHLARLHPESLVIGIDRSAARLDHGVRMEMPFRDGRCIWVRAELASFWRLAFGAGWRPAHHYLLYPNPWPKPSHLSRRWHGHPVFPTLLRLGGEIELRCNWHIYAEEFAAAAAEITGIASELDRIRGESPVSPFERKYLASGHELYRVRVVGLKKAPVSRGFNCY